MRAVHSVPAMRKRRFNGRLTSASATFVLTMSAVHRGAIRIAAWIAIATSSAVLGQQGQAPPGGGQPATHQQDPGAGAQVHTGTSSGLSGDARIQNLLADHQYFRVQSELDELPPQEAQFYRGILANRNNDPKESIKLLEP